MTKEEINEVNTYRVHVGEIFRKKISSWIGDKKEILPSETKKIILFFESLEIATSIEEINNLIIKYENQ